MGNRNSAFTCNYVYRPQDSKGTKSKSKNREYTTGLEARQYRRPPYNMIPDRRLRRVQKNRKRRTLYLGDTIKILIHNFILDNVNRNSPHGAPGESRWTTALLAVVRREDGQATAYDINRWVRNHKWIKERHRLFVRQRNNRDNNAEPRITTEPFSVQHIYTNGRGSREYTVDLEFLQYHRLPNNHIDGRTDRRLERERSIQVDDKKKCKPTLRPLLRKAKVKRKIKSLRKLNFGDAYKLLTHNFILDNVQEGEPNGIPGDKEWAKALTSKLREHDDRPTQDDVNRWIDEYCWITIRHNEWTQQRM